MDAAQVRDALTGHVVVVLEVAQRRRQDAAQGTLVFMGGTGGRRNGHGLGIVSAATAATPPFTAASALELVPSRVSLIAAGFADTPLSAALLADQLGSGARNCG
jgi:NAD(P)-dependent dehydrogenase (short-subunit alcohol dehydrogenase family)